MVNRPIRAHDGGLALNRKAVMAPGSEDEADLKATRSFDLAAARSWDEELAEHAVAVKVQTSITLTQADLSSLMGCRPSKVPSPERSGCDNTVTTNTLICRSRNVDLPSPPLRELRRSPGGPRRPAG